jgi:hypothetical protein
MAARYGDSHGSCKEGEAEEAWNRHATHFNGEPFGMLEL